MTGTKKERRTGAVAYILSIFLRLNASNNIPSYDLQKQTVVNLVVNNEHCVEGLLHEIQL